MGTAGLSALLPGWRSTGETKQGEVGLAAELAATGDTGVQIA
jgi:hypothetical protein